MYKVLISDDVANECVKMFESIEGIEVDCRPGLSPDEFKAIIGEYDGLVVRSQTKVRGDAIALAKKLKVIGRAGAGVDNIDVASATDAGIVVMNTPGGNTVSTAEHTLSLIMALSRNIAQGDRSIKEGKWERKKYMGVELRGKTIGVIGLGNIGQVVVHLAMTFGMKVLGHDPFLSTDLAESLGITIAALDEIWANADYITFHTPLNDSTRHLINEKTLAKCKDGVRIINCARGGIVDEQALLRAIESGKVAGAALDVFEQEPPVNNPLVRHEKVVCTPHLGASTAEAQDIVALMVAEQVRDYLLTGEVRNAVNMPSLASEIYEQVKPFMNLGYRMGALIGQLCEGQLNTITITYFGDLTNVNIWPITSSILQGVFARSYFEGVNIINARSTAEKHGIMVQEVKSTLEQDFKNCLEVKLKTSKDESTVLGSIFGRKDPRVINLNGFSIDFVPEGNMLICSNHDRPGLIGSIGTILGANRINIAQMTWARLTPDGDALTVLNTDEDVSNKVVAEVKKIDGIRWVKSVIL
ncbi:phosphoglycerate dehydrogenase [Candidatus Latescibacterota bacterium]